ncbi:amidohydrolase [Actinobacteria bacterium YIM 96077]|uniref:Amidohydrolase n=1 Tax=Phytoactinopolyspora halophila TaxID=1981511 RepID=A0A329QT44_9ACTN|nr:amidohydrolase family protein [Phytoactinopolyspora halophila]AYY14990.1 amidohydrolase [Actinobacteria bacterium YIM 96077]RAW15447.1 amidohydrolase [Phytoactinopolyspora halophila]
MSSRLAIVGAATVLSGDHAAPLLPGTDTIICDDGLITAVGTRDDLDAEIADAGTVVDARGTTIAPGLIDSHCHVVLGDYTPRQKTVDFLASYVHGGITSVVSPGEIHAPGRPHDAAGVKALAIAARACFENLRPGGMRVHAGAVVLEPTLGRDDFAELQRAGVHLAKFGFGRYADPSDGVDQVRWAQQHGITVMCHSGGASIPGSKPITPEHLRELAPDVCGHINGGPTSLDEAGVDAVIEETSMALQLVQAGNVRSAVRILHKALDTGQFHRVVIGSDTPTGTGVMPLGVLKTVAELSSLGELDPAMVWAAATGSNARTWGLPSGFVRPGAAADLIVMDAPWGSTATDALGALRIGDLPGISAVVTAGSVRALRSRNTPAAARQATVSPELPHLEGAH